jgi:sporulation protein YlmC with PRC-barrel domain
MEEYMDRTKFLIILFFCFISLNEVFALTAVSNSYSVNMFGNSISTGNANSTSYIATFLSENLGTNNNAIANSFMSNIGFFETGYFTTVSISSYSISPKSAQIGSTIGLSVTANNAQSVWVEITAPNSQTQLLNLINGQTINYLPVPSIVGRYNITFYANSSTGAIASVVDYFDLTEQVTPSNNPSSGGGGSGGTGSIQSCNYNWDCTPWSLCSNGLQARTCTNIGTCSGNESKPIEIMSCNQALFDISLDLENVQYFDDKIRFFIRLDEQFGVEELDVHLKYSIIDSQNFEIFSRIETIAVMGSLELGKELSLGLNDGDYTLRVDVLYGNLQRAFAEQSFVVSRENNGITGFALMDYVNSRRITFSVILFVISFIILLGGYYSLVINNGKDKKSNSLKDLLGLDVYASNGMKIGKVYDIELHDNVVYGLAVLVDKDAPISYPRVLIRYSYVNNVNDVVVVDSSIFGNGAHESA